MRITFTFATIPSTVESVDTNLLLPSKQYYPVEKTIYVPYKVYEEQEVYFFHRYPVIKEVPVPIAVPVEVPIIKQVQVPYPVPVLKLTPVPVPIKVPKPYPIIKEVRVPVKIPIKVPKPYPVEKIIRYPVRFFSKRPVPYKIEQPVAVTEEKFIPVPVEKPVPYPVKVEVSRPVPYLVEKEVLYPVKVPVKIPIPVEGVNEYSQYDKREYIKDDETETRVKNVVPEQNFLESVRKERITNKITENISNSLQDDLPDNQKSKTDTNDAKIFVSNYKDDEIIIKFEDKNNKTENIDDRRLEEAKNVPNDYVKEIHEEKQDVEDNIKNNETNVVKYMYKTNIQKII